MQWTNNGINNFRRGLFNDATADLNNAVIDVLGVNNTLTIPDDTITTPKILNNAVTNDKILSVDASKITGTIGNIQIADNSITEEKIISLPFTKITGTINTDTQILDNTIWFNKMTGILDPNIFLANESITNAYIGPNAITANKINNSAVINWKIAIDAVSTDKIQNGAVTNDK